MGTLRKIAIGNLGKGKYWYYIHALKREPVIIYQMGQVGSVSIRDSLKACNNVIKPVYHLHRLNPSNESLRGYPWICHRLFLDIVLGQRPAKFITLVRDPISKNVSNFFYHITRFAGKDYHQLSIENLTECFLKNAEHQVPLRWFDLEVKPMLGIDVYQYPFPKDMGYLLIRNGIRELLILKTETDDRIKEHAVKEFLGIPEFKLTRHNVGVNRSQGNLYKEFLQTVQLPESYMDEMCESNYMAHFYSEAEIDATQQKWKRK